MIGGGTEAAGAGLVGSPAFDGVGGAAPLFEDLVIAREPLFLAGGGVAGETVAGGPAYQERSNSSSFVEPLVYSLLVCAGALALILGLRRRLSRATDAESKPLRVGHRVRSRSDPG